MFDKIRAAIIDNGVNKELYYELTGKCIEAYKIIDTVCVLDEDDTGNYGLNHGTVCASILAEFACDTEILSISLGEQEKLPVQNLEAALKWCANNQIDVICMSIGVTSFLELSHLFPLFNSLIKQGIMVAAAASNDGRITYPASLPSVIGVRHVNGASKRMTIINNPIDGIDIEAELPKSNILIKLREDFNFINPITNSMVTPYVTAKIIEFIVRGNKSNPLYNLKQSFGAYMNAEFRETGKSSSSIPKENIPAVLENISVPIIALIYDDEQPDDKRLDTEQIDTERLDTERLDTERLDTERLDTERLDTERLDIERINTEQLDTKYVDTGQLDTEQLGTVQFDTDWIKDSRIKEGAQLSVSLKKIFCRNGYNSILFSTSMERNIEDNVFKLDEENMASDIFRYIQITLSDIILLHMPKRLFKHYNRDNFIDLIISCEYMENDYQEEGNILYVSMNSGNKEAQAELIFNKIIEIFV
jgi:hypothetical protein